MQYIIPHYYKKVLHVSAGTVRILAAQGGRL